MSFTARLHAFTQSYDEEPILTEAWYEIAEPSVSILPQSAAQYLRGIALAYTTTNSELIEPEVLDDFNWGNFVELVPEDYLNFQQVYSLPYGSQCDVTVFVDHDERILERYAEPL